MKFLPFILFLQVCVIGLAQNRFVDSWELLSGAKVDSQGIFLSSVVKSKSGLPVPQLRLTNAPAHDRSMTLSRAVINQMLWGIAPELVCTNWSGAEKVKVTRVTRTLDEAALRELLLMTLQNEVVRDRGELEMKLAKAWNPIQAPDELWKIRLVDLPLSGVAPSFLCRFELRAGDEVIGTYTLQLQAKIMREVFVASSNVSRGTLLGDAPIRLERRDILTLRDTLSQVPGESSYYEIAENIQAGMPLTSRSLRLKAVVKRGRVLDALAEDPAIRISVKVEALEDGVPGQMVRVRNIKSRREFRAKVQDEQTVQVLF